MIRFCILIIFFACSINLAFAQPTDWSNVEKIIGRKGSLQNGIFKINFQRTDLKVKVNGISIDPELIANSWVSFRSMKNDTMMMGELTLRENEVEPVISKLVENGLEISSLHNLLIGDNPRIMDMHFEGKGDSVKLAHAFKSVISQIKIPMQAKPESRSLSDDWRQIEQILGLGGKKQGNIIEFTVPRAETITQDGMKLSPIIDIPIIIHMQKANDKAISTGEFILKGDEVNPVVRALTQNGINVTAIHNHMLYETPRMFYVHYWGYDKPEKLAKGIKAAIDKTN